MPCHVAGGRVVSIGITPWGMVEKRHELVGKKMDVPFHSVAQPRSVTRSQEWQMEVVIVIVFHHLLAKVATLRAVKRCSKIHTSFPLRPSLPQGHLFWLTLIEMGFALCPRSAHPRLLIKCLSFGSLAVAGCSGSQIYDSIQKVHSQLRDCTHNDIIVVEVG